MTLAQLTAEAEKVVDSTRHRLPPEIAVIANGLPVCFYDLPTPEMLGKEFDPDILGLFVGDHHGIDTGRSNAVPAQIFLFIDNLIDEAEGDLDVFREEVRLTYLHELGHYLGWDEADVEARGL